jgi:hypothetical protein
LRSELPQAPGNIPRSGHLYGATRDPIGIGNVAALGTADHRYNAKTDARVGDGFFFRQETAAVVPPPELEPKPLSPQE